MGWLRELMGQAGLRSFGELARQALSHPAWPADSRAQPRSLEAILGRLDRREDLEWLAERPGVQQVLATLLDCQIAELRTVLLQAGDPRTRLNRFKFDDLPMARALELQEEMLPPGIPERVGLPGTWGRIAWHAPAGSGFDLASAWLCARGLAQSSVVTADSPAPDARSQGPSYVQLGDGDAFAALCNLRKGARLCLALPSHGDIDEAALRREGFEILRSPPVEGFLTQLVDWVLLRSHQGFVARRDALLHFLTTGPLAWGVVQSFGDLLGYVGAYLAADAQDAWHTSREAFVRRWLTERSRALARSQLRDKTALGKLLPSALIDMAQAALLDDSRSLIAPRSLEEWLELVPPQHQRGPDLDWLVAQLGGLDQSLQPRDVERAAKRLPPGAHRLVVMLRELSLLQPLDASRFQFRPHFIARLLQAIAEERTVSGAPVFWGEGLLKPKARSALLRALTQRIVRSPLPIAEELLEVVDEHNSALVSALESGFVLIGLQVLAGTELAGSVALGLLEEQDALLVKGPGALPLRRTIPSGTPELSDSDGAFYLASLALSEIGRPRKGSVSPLLAPWELSEPQAGWGRVLDAIEGTLARAVVERPAWLLPALSLLERVRQVLGSCREPKASRANEDARGAPADTLPRDDDAAAAHPLFAAALLMDAIELSVADPREVANFLSDHANFDKFLLTVQARERSAAKVLGAVWQLLSEHGDPELIRAFLERTPEGFWQHAPPATLCSILLSHGSGNGRIPWGSLGPSTWEAWAKQRQTHSAPHEAVEPWQHVPYAFGEAQARALVSAEAPVLSAVWKRWPHVALEHIERHRTLRPDLAVNWLSCMPLSELGATARLALDQKWQKADERVRVATLAVFCRGIAQRAAGWDLAYDCLCLIETERRKVH